MKRLLIYVAGPYTAATYGDEQANVDRAMDTALSLVALGHVPIVPHLSHYLDHRHAYHTNKRLPWAVWMELDRVLLERCDALFFLGESPGACAELRHAKELQLPVFFSIEAVPRA